MPEQKVPIEEGRLGFGTTPAFDAFVKTISNYRGNNEIILAVNISTLLRNNVSGKPAATTAFPVANDRPQVNTAEVVRKTQQHMVEMANELANICDMRFKGRKHHILFYMTDTSKQIPSAWMRPKVSASSVALDSVLRAFSNSAHSGDQTYHETQMHIRLANQMRVPSYKGIGEVLKGWTTPEMEIHLISHEPLDYHVANYIGRKGYLYRSHTGAVVPLTPSELGKVVFKIEDLPFYTTTHVLMGDKSLIKGCLAKKDRDRLIKLAAENHWGLRTHEYISVKVKEYGLTPAYSLN